MNSPQEPLSATQAALDDLLVTMSTAIIKCWSLTGTDLANEVARDTAAYLEARAKDAPDDEH